MRHSAVFEISAIYTYRARSVRTACGGRATFNENRLRSVDRHAKRRSFHPSVRKTHEGDFSASSWTGNWNVANRMPPGALSLKDSTSISPCQIYWGHQRGLTDCWVSSARAAAAAAASSSSSSSRGLYHTSVCIELLIANNFITFHSLWDAILTTHIHTRSIFAFACEAVFVVKYKRNLLAYPRWNLDILLNNSARNKLSARVKEKKESVSRLTFRKLSFSNWDCCHVPSIIAN